MEEGFHITLGDTPVIQEVTFEWVIPRKGGGEWNEETGEYEDEYTWYMPWEERQTYDPVTKQYLNTTSMSLEDARNIALVWQELFENPQQLEGAFEPEPARPARPARPLGKKARQKEKQKNWRR